jgi:hypothetical protein
MNINILTSCTRTVKGENTKYKVQQEAKFNTVISILVLKDTSTISVCI